MCRRTLRLAVLAGWAGVAMLLRLAVVVSRTTMLRLLMALPTGERPVPEVLCVDDFALARTPTPLCDPADRRGHPPPRRCAAGRKAATVAAWLREHPGVKIVCRDGSAAYAKAIRQGAPHAVQVSDRWHLWHGLAGGGQDRERPQSL